MCEPRSACVAAGADSRARPSDGHAGRVSLALGVGPGQAPAPPVHPPLAALKEPARLLAHRPLAVRPLVPGTEEPRSTRVVPGVGS